MASRELLVLLLLTGVNQSLISYDFHYVIIVNFRVIQTIKDENRKKTKLKHSNCSSDVTVAHTIFPIQSMFPTWIDHNTNTKFHNMNLQEIYIYRYHRYLSIC